MRARIIKKSDAGLENFFNSTKPAPLDGMDDPNMQIDTILSLAQRQRPRTGANYTTQTAEFLRTTGDQVKIQSLLSSNQKNSMHVSNLGLTSDALQIA
jgi:hypothetical protein